LNTQGKNLIGSRPSSAVPFLSVENIRAAYGKKEVLGGVSLSIGAGEIVALIGPNGAGKSTLLKVLAGLLRPQGGEVWWDDENVTHVPPTGRMRRGLAYFLQGGKVFPSLSVQENLAMGALGLSQEARDESLERVFGLFPGLKEMKGKRAGLLSGGQRQALALGIVLMRKPRLLLLDEPSAGLAPNLVTETLAKVREINETLGTSILLVEQNVREAVNVSEVVYLLRNGQIVGREEEPERLLEAGRLEEVFFS